LKKNGKFEKNEMHSDDGVSGLCQTLPATYQSLSSQNSRKFN
jgi:hypothetical protein